MMRDLILFVFLTIGYTAVARLSMLLTGGLSPISADYWPASGISLASIVILLRHWDFKRVCRVSLFVPLGAFLAVLWNGASAYLAAGFALCSSLEVGVAVLIYSLFVRKTVFSNPKLVLQFLFVCAAPSAAISAGAALLWLHLSGNDQFIEAKDFVFSWFNGHVLGALIYTPFILTVADRGCLRSFRVHRRTRILEFTGWALATSLASLGAFTPLAVNLGWFAQPPALLALLLGWALRYEMLGATLGAVVASLVAVISAYFGLAPVFLGGSEGRLINPQLYLLVFSFANILLASVISERASVQRDVERMIGKLKESIQQRDEFIMIASHELRTPLAPMRIQIQLLTRSARAIPTLIEENVGRQLLNLEQQIDRMVQLVEELLDFSQIINQKLRLKIESVDLIALMGNLVERFKMISPSGSRINFKTNGALSVQCDPLRIEQLLNNLIHNAFKFCAAGPIELVLDLSPDQVRLVVTDHGPGIPEKDRERLFERFERNVSSRYISGFGLGLYICREIVQAHQGRIWVEEEPGGGARFVVEFPREVKISAA